MNMQVKRLGVWLLITAVIALMFYGVTRAGLAYGQQVGSCGTHYTYTSYEFWVYHWGGARQKQFGPFEKRETAEALMVKLAPDRVGLAIAQRTDGKISSVGYYMDGLPEWPRPGQDPPKPGAKPIAVERKE